VSVRLSARRAQEQGRPHALLHQRKLTADRRLGKAEQAAGGAQGAGLHDFYKERHSGEVNSVCHRSNYRTLEFQMRLYCSARSGSKFPFTINVHQQESKAMSTKTYTEARFSANDTALVLIDHQSGIMHDYSPAEFRNNVMALAKLGKAFNLPTVLTTSLGQGPSTAWSMPPARLRLQSERMPLPE
jgi:hypothetical protein